MKTIVERLITFGQLWEYDIDDDEGYILDTYVQPAESCMMIRGKAQPLLVKLDGKLCSRQVDSLPLRGFF